MADRALGLILRHKLTWLALAVMAGLEAAFFVWFAPSALMMLAALGLGLLCLVAWPLIFARSAAFAAALAARPRADEAARQRKVAELIADFEELAFAQGNAQLRMLEEKFDNLAEILRRRLDNGELTYARYLGMAEQVYFSAFDNLHEVAVGLRSVRTIDHDYIRERLAALSRVAELSGEEREESEALQQRSRLYDEQQQRVAQLVAQNESAMTVLDKTAAALAGTKTTRGQASMDASAAIEELERLAQRAGDYAAQH